MTFISWFLEFTTGVGGVVIRLFNDLDIDIINWLVFIDVCLNFIIIPSSYILNNEVNKKLIIANGWCKGFRRLFQTNKVNPVQNEELELAVVPAPVPPPIPTISGNINALLQQNLPENIANNLERSFETAADRQSAQNSHTPTFSNEGQQSTGSNQSMPPNADTIVSVQTENNDSDIENILLDNCPRGSIHQPSVPKIFITA